jgi:glycosyltransferase involved in cell wall biosynthesis
VLVPVLDEEEHIGKALTAMRAQAFDGHIEFLFIDGGSRDQTREIVRRAAMEDARVRLLDNPHRRTPQALNIGLEAARGDHVVRMDAHTLYPDDYIARGVARLRQGDVEWASGVQAPHGIGRRSRQVARALGSPIGTGGATFRHLPEKEVESPSGFTGVWRRETLERHGGWDEGWPINQDSELAARIRKSGGRIVCLPEMTARYIPRGSFSTLARQYLRYGHYRAKTSARHPETVRRSHLLPPALVLTVVGALLGPRRLRRAARATVLLYVTTVVGESVRLAGRESPRDVLALPAIFAAMHLAWGIGFITGCARFASRPAGVRR